MNQTDTKKNVFEVEHSVPSANIINAELVERVVRCVKEIVDSQRDLLDKGCSDTVLDKTLGNGLVALRVEMIHILQLQRSLLTAIGSQKSTEDVCETLDSIEYDQNITLELQREKNCCLDDLSKEVDSILNIE